MQARLADAEAHGERRASLFQAPHNDDVRFMRRSMSLLKYCLGATRAATRAAAIRACARAARESMSCCCAIKWRSGPRSSLHVEGALRKRSARRNAPRSAARRSRHNRAAARLQRSGRLAAMPNCAIRTPHAIVCAVSHAANMLRLAGLRSMLGRARSFATEAVVSEAVVRTALEEALKPSVLKVDDLRCVAHKPCYVACADADVLA